MKKNYIILFLALVFSNLSFAQNFNAIEPELHKILNQKSEELIDIQIYFKSSIKADKLNQATRKAYTKSEKKEIVVNELKSYSENVQADVMSILEAEELNGNVSDIHNLWIANSISCKASASVIYTLSSHPDVKMIGYDKEFQLISPEQMEGIKSESKSDVRAGGPDAHVQTVDAHKVWWEKGYTGKNIVVAVLDSGTNTNHLDLKDHLWIGYVDTNNDGTPDTYVNGWNFINNSSNITDDYGHGTHCAGIVCGDGTSMITTGIAPDALLMTVKTINRAGGGSVAQMLKGVQFAVENGANVLSMSLGFKNSQLTTAQKEEIRAAFDNVLAAGVVVCAAAGNDGNTYGAPDNVDYPAACPAPWRNPDQTLEGGVSSVICVGAHDLNESSRGPSTWEGTSYNDYPYNGGESMGLIRPDISAPGYIIRSTKYNQNDIYELKSGTSQATPIVAGVIALMLEKNSTLTPAQISQIIEETATSKPETKNNNVGAGIVNALAAVNSITETVGNPFVQVNAFTPKAVSTGNQTIGVTLKNNGAGASDENTSVTLSLSNDPYVTIANPTQTLGKIGVNSTKTLFFNLNIDENTPSGHTVTFAIKTTSGSFTWNETFSIKVETTPHLTLKSVTPSIVNISSTSEICVTMVNDGTTAFTDSVKLTLRTIKSDSAYATVINNETMIKPLGVGESGTGTFTLQTSNVPHEFYFFLDTYSEFNAPVSFVYEFEKDMEGWTTFKAGSSYTKAPWMHSTSAITLTTVKDSHSGEGHLMSIAYQNGVAQQYSPINNYLVSPNKIKVTENTKVSFYASGNNNFGYKEHFGVAVSTTGNTSANDFTTIEEWIISEKTTWTKYTADLSAYAGQEIYVAIRHFFTAKEWEDSYCGYDYDALNIDDITFENVTLPIQYISTLSGDDPYLFNVRSSVINSLPKVQNFTATAISSSKIELTWDAIPEAAYYTIYQGTNVVATKVIGDKYTVTGLQSEEEYCYNIVAVSSIGQSEYSDPACATTFETPVIPDAPAAPTATAKSSSTIALKWNAVEGADVYGIYQDDVLIESAIADTTFIVEGLEAEKEYCFSITAVNNGGESEKSESACATTLEDSGDDPIDPTPEPDPEPEVPTLAAPVVTAEATSDSTIVLTWNAVESAIRYNIYCGDSTIKLAVRDTTYTVTGLEANTQYCFNVVAVNTECKSEKSADACATTFKAEEPEEPGDEPIEPEQPADSTTLAAPTNLRAKVEQDLADYPAYKYKITMMWDAVEGAQGYDVYVNTTKEQDFYFGYTGGTAYVAGSNEETTFEFYIVAFNQDKDIESEPSEICTVNVVDDAVGEMTASFNVYPNPVQDKLYIETEAEIEEVVVYDVYGRQQTTVNGQQSSSIDISNLNSGVYFIKVVTTEGEVVKRIIKN